MVKTVQADYSISDYFDGLLKQRVQAQVGLLVGKSSVGSRDIALGVIPTPTQEDQQVLTLHTGNAASSQKKGTAKVKPSEPAVSIDLEAEWVAEHALQVSRMLPGGVSVLGLYLFAPASGLTSAAVHLCSALANIAADSESSSSNVALTAAVVSAAKGITAATAAAHRTTAAARNTGELLLLHVDSTSRKFTVRSCQPSSASDAASTLIPCELKFGPSLSSLVCLRCSHSFDCSVPVSSDGASMQQLLQKAAATEAARVLSAVAVVNGQMASGSTQAVADLITNNTGSTEQQVIVDLCCLPSSTYLLLAPQNAVSLTHNNSINSSSTSACAGYSRLQGTIEAIAYVHRRDSVSKAVSEIKHDAVSSLSARLQLLAEEALVAADEAAATAANSTNCQKGTAVGSNTTGGAESAATAAANSGLLSVDAAKHVELAMPRRVLLSWQKLGLLVGLVVSSVVQVDFETESAQQMYYCFTEVTEANLLAWSVVLARTR
eukprot:GHRR01022957.1.p1 GENE.GHRR01022957.1~~GHRR01022957.1.p1  ORF type:complete len:492 (+),score=177.26 GHRR01022957.1:381-1856(+)